MSRPRFVALLTAVLLVAPVVSGTALASPATELFQAASTDLLDNYYGWSDLDRPALVARYAAALDSECAASGDACTYDQGRAVVRQMLTELHDAHTNIRDAEGAEWLREVQQDLTVPRTGLRVVKTGLGLLVVGVMPGSPAEAAGVQRFDLLTSLNGQPETGGVADSAAFVRLERQAAPIQADLLHAGQPRSLTLTTAPMKARDVPILSWQPGTAGKVAVIQYPTFLSVDSAELFLKALDEAQAGGAAGLVIDLRYNGGGHIDQCVQAASAFRPALYQAHVLLRMQIHPRVPQENNRAPGSPASPAAAAPPAPVPFGSWDYAALGGRSKSPDSVRRALSGPDPDLQGLWHGPAALLIDENTASCAEVFGFFAHQAGAVLVGQPTKGVMNSGVNFFPLPDHGVMSLTMLRAYDQAGQPLPDHLQPDMNVPVDLAALVEHGQDTVLETALKAVQARLANHGAAPAPAGSP